MSKELMIPAKANEMTPSSKKPVGFTRDIQYYKKRYAKARSTADLWVSLFEACYHYTIPSRNLFYWTSQYQGAQKNARVYDTTPVAGVRTFVAKVQGALTPPQQTWALLVAGEDIPPEDKEMVDKQLQATTDKMFSYLRHSNFDLAINETYYDLAVGTGALLCNEGPDDNPLIFASVPLARLAIESSLNTRIESCYRWWDEVKIQDIQTMWPKARLTPTMRSLLDADPCAIIKDLVEGTVYEPDRKDKPYTYLLMHENEGILREDIDSSPWIVFRWSKVNNEIYGRGPVIEALPSILSLNEAARFEFTAANMSVNKPIMAYSDGVFNPWTFKLEPNTVIPVSPNSAGQFPIQPFPETANPQFMQLTSADLRQQINKLLYADPLGPVDMAPTRTATELALRQRNLAEEIGPLFTRLQQEFLGPLIKRILYILQKKGFIEPIIVNGREIQIQYQSPLVIAQGQQDVQNFLQWYQFIASIQGPEAALVNINPAVLPPWSAAKLGVDKNLVQSEEQLKKFYKEQNEQQNMIAEQGALGGAAGPSP